MPLNLTHSLRFDQDGTHGAEIENFCRPNYPLIHYNIHAGCKAVFVFILAYSQCALSQCREGEGPETFSLTAVCAEAHSV